MTKALGEVIARSIKSDMLESVRSVASEGGGTPECVECAGDEILRFCRSIDGDSWPLHLKHVRKHYYPSQYLYENPMELAIVVRRKNGTSAARSLRA